VTCHRADSPTDPTAPQSHRADSPGRHRREYGQTPDHRQGRPSHGPTWSGTDAMSRWATIYFPGGSVSGTPTDSATGCSAAWLARHVRDVEVPGSNPGSPTTGIGALSLFRAHVAGARSCPPAPIQDRSNWHVSGTNLARRSLVASWVHHDGRRWSQGGPPMPLAPVARCAEAPHQLQPGWTI